MELKDPETPKKPNKRICRCCASHFRACYDAINNFGKLGIKENVAEKLKQIEKIQVTPDCEEFLRTKICKKFFTKVTAPSKWCEEISDSFNN